MRDRKRQEGEIKKGEKEMVFCKDCPNNKDVGYAWKKKIQRRRER